VRIAPAVLSAVLMTSVAAAADKSPPLEQSIVQNFKPLSIPSSRVLRGWVIGIDPAVAVGSQRDEDARTDRSLLTTAHLYHFVRRAGGSALLTRVDETAAAASTPPSLAQRITRVHTSGGEVLLLVRYGGPGAIPAVILPKTGVGPSGIRLAEALAAALRIEVHEATSAGGAVEDVAGALREADVPADWPVCEIRLRGPEGPSVLGPAERKAALDDARSLYEGLRRFCKQQAADRSSSTDASDVPDYAHTQAANHYERLGRSVWPESSLPPGRVDWFCRAFARAALSDRSLVYFDVSAELDGSAAVLHGSTNVPAVAVGLQKTLESLGVTVARSEIRALPDREHLGERLFGVCRAPTAMTYERPDRGAMQTQLLFGEALFLLDRAGEHVLLHAADGYWGWVHQDAIQMLAAEAFDAYTRLPRAVALGDLQLGAQRVPRGASLRVLRNDSDGLIIRFADGSTATAAPDALKMPGDERAEATERVRTALDLLYVPYVFGGRSPLGLDCSGLVSNVWGRAGFNLPRDAWQQAFGGLLVATRAHRAGILPGDQLFFINTRGKVYHTAIALDTERFVHSAPPCVQISSFDPDDPLYDAELSEDFLLAKRP